MKNILILYPYRFRNYDYDRFELRFLKKKYNIIILDILDLIHPHFKEAYKKEKLKFKVIKPKNIKNLFFFFKKIQEFKQHNYF